MEGFYGNKDMSFYQEKLKEALDPDNEYTHDDFMVEFGGNQLLDNIPKIDIKFVNESKNPDPDWKTSGSAGFDLRANTYGSIEPHQFKIIPTGLFFDLPDNFEMQLRPRSGLAAKHGVTVLNSPCTIDSDYTGEIKVILINHSDKTFNIATGERIGQAVISTVMGKNILSLNKVSKITKETERGAGGFGSTVLR